MILRFLKKAIFLRALLLIAWGFPIVLLCGCMLFTPSYTILLILGDSHPAEDPNAHRMEIAAQIAWQDHYDPMKYPFSLTLRVLPDTEELGRWIANREEPSTNQPTIAVIGGDTASLSRRLAEMTADKKIVHISPAPGDDRLYAEHPHSFATRGSAVQEAEIMELILLNYCAEQSIEIVYHPSLEWVERMEAFLSILENHTHFPVQLVEYSFDNMRLPRTKSPNQESSDPSVLILFLPREDCRDFLARDLDSLRSHRIIVSSQSIDSELESLSETLDTSIYAVMPRVEYDTSPSAHPHSNLDWERFAQRYQAQTGQKELDALAADTYAAVYALLEVIRINGESFDAILEGLYEYKGYGITGPIAFTLAGIVEENPYVPVQIFAQGPILLRHSPLKSEE